MSISIDLEDLKLISKHLFSTLSKVKTLVLDISGNMSDNTNEAIDKVLSLPSL